MVKSLRDLALVIVAGLMVLFGLWMAFFAIGWAGRLPWLLPLLSVASLCILLLLLWAQQRWRLSQAPANRQKAGKGRARVPHAEENEQKVIELATLRYELSDAEEPALFATFLDQPRLMMQGAQPTAGYETPGQVIENAVLAYIKEIEEASQGQVTATVAITRGSLTVSLAFLSLYGFLAQYHDFVESLSLLRQQMQGVLHQVNHWYYMESGRAMHVRSDIQLASPAASRQQAAKAQAAETTFDPTHPVQVTTTVAPQHDIRIHVANSSFINWLLAVLLSAAILIQLFVLLLYLSCISEGNGPHCTDFIGQLMGWFTYFLEQVGAL